MSRQQSLSTLSTTVGTETVESARSKKVLKKHLQRSIGELVAAKEQLPEEEGREVAQGITDRIKALQLQKDGLMSVARKKKGFCATRGVGKDTRIQAQSPTAGTGGFGRSESKTSCCSRGMCKRGTRNRRGGRPRRGDARRGPEQHKGSLPRLVQLVRLYFTVKRVERDAHSDFADLRYPCTSAKNSSPCCCGSWYDGETAADSCTADRCTCGGNCKLRRPDRVSCPCNSKAASDGSRGGTRSSRYDSSWKLCRRCHECTEPFSQHIRTAQTVLANKYAEHWCSLPESKEMVGEAEAPMNSILSVGQLRSRVSSCVHLPLLFQLSPGAVSDMWCGAVATDDDTVWYIEIFTDGSSLIPKAWPRVAASGGWGVLVSAICDNQRIAVTGMFFGDVTVSSGHLFFCGANTVQIGACEIQAILAALAWCHDVNVEAKSVTIRPDSMYPIGVLDRSHCCISHVQLVRATRHCLENARNKWRVNFKHTKAHQGQWQNELADSLAKMGSYSFPWKARCSCRWHGGTNILRHQHRQSP